MTSPSSSEQQESPERRLLREWLADAVLSPDTSELHARTRVLLARQEGQNNVLAAPSPEHRLSKPEDGALRTPEDIRAASSEKPREGATPRTDKLRKRKYANAGRRLVGALEAHENLERDLNGAMDRCDEALAFAEQAVKQRDALQSATAPSEGALRAAKEWEAGVSSNEIDFNAMAHDILRRADNCNKEK